MDVWVVEIGESHERHVHGVYADVEQAKRESGGADADWRQDSAGDWWHNGAVGGGYRGVMVSRFEVATR